MKAASLVLLDADNNRNASFTMRQISERLFETEFARVGADVYKMTYPMSRYDAILEKHLKEGYVIRSTGESEHRMYKPIEDRAVERLVNKLTRASRRLIQQYYQIDPMLVTAKMVEEAQALIYAIKDANDIEDVNEILKTLATVIPRKLSDVKADLLLTDIETKEEITSREQELLDIMASEVESEDRKDPGQTILEAYGVSIRSCSEKEEQEIKSRMRECGRYFRRAFRIHNALTDQRFETYCKAHNLSKEHVHFLYHGSTNPNWFSLVTQGQKLNPDAPITGKMFGHGLYFADDAHKSLGYTSINGSRWAGGKEKEGFLAVCKVAYKHPLHTDETNYRFQSMTDTTVRPYDAVFAHKGAQLRKNEIIVYREAQATWQYLVQLKEG